VSASRNPVADEDAILHNTVSPRRLTALSPAEDLRLYEFAVDGVAPASVSIARRERKDVSSPVILAQHLDPGIARWLSVLRKLALAFVSHNHSLESNLASAP
jgi:hypothetical protein